MLQRGSYIIRDIEVDLDGFVSDGLAFFCFALRPFGLNLQLQKYIHKHTQRFPRDYI